MLQEEQTQTVTFIKRTDKVFPEQTVGIDEIIKKLNYPVNDVVCPYWLDAIINLISGMKDENERQCLSKMIVEKIDSKKCSQLMCLMIQKEFEKDENRFLRDNGTFIKTFMKCEGDRWLRENIINKLIPHLNDFILLVDNMLAMKDYSVKSVELLKSCSPEFLQSIYGVFSEMLNIILGVSFNLVITRTCHYIAHYSSDKTEAAINGYISGYLILTIINPAIVEYLATPSYYERDDIDRVHACLVKECCSLLCGMFFQKNLQDLFSTNKAPSPNEKTHMVMALKATAFLKRAKTISNEAEIIYLSTHKRIPTALERSLRTTIDLLREDVKPQNTESALKEIELLENILQRKIEETDKKKEAEFFAQMQSKHLLRLTTEQKIINVEADRLHQLDGALKAAQISEKDYRIEQQRSMYNVKTATEKRRAEKTLVRELENFVVDIRRCSDGLEKTWKRLKTWLAKDSEKLVGFLAMGDQHAETPIGAALEFNNQKLAKKMLKCNIQKLSTSFSKDESILDIIIKKDYTDLFDWVIKELPVITALDNSNNYFNPLMGAITKNWSSRIGIIINKTVINIEPHASMEHLLQPFPGRKVHPVEHKIYGKTILHRTIEERANEGTIHAVFKNTPVNVLVNHINTPCEKDNTLPIIAALRRHRFEEAVFVMKYISENKLKIPSIEKSNDDPLLNVAKKVDDIFSMITMDYKIIMLSKNFENKNFHDYILQLAAYKKWFDGYVPITNDRTTVDTANICRCLLFVTSGIGECLANGDVTDDVSIKKHYKNCIEKLMEFTTEVEGFIKSINETKWRRGSVLIRKVLFYLCHAFILFETSTELYFI